MQTNSSPRGGGEEALGLCGFLALVKLQEDLDFKGPPDLLKARPFLKISA